MYMMKHTQASERYCNANYKKHHILRMHCNWRGFNINNNAFVKVENACVESSHRTLCRSYVFSCVVDLCPSCINHVSVFPSSSASTGFSLLSKLFSLLFSFITSSVVRALGRSFSGSSSLLCSSFSLLSPSSPFFLASSSLSVIVLFFKHSIPAFTRRSDPFLLADLEEMPDLDESFLRELAREPAREFARDPARDTALELARDFGDPVIPIWLLFDK
mmetsp:Transcript_17064/g.34565  ORF Transcript_17064/g.34565 Transcript_17064/m.34565 type:complete len:218 (-) Transcript_17064:529-1182(-)